MALGDADATLHVRNTGRTEVRFWGETDSTATPGNGETQQTRIDKSLVPVGHTRSIAISAEPDWPVGYVTIRVRVIYPGTTESATKEIVITKRVLVVSPWVVAAAVALLMGAIVLLVRRWRRGRSNRRARRSEPGPSRSPGGSRHALKTVPAGHNRSGKRRGRGSGRGRGRPGRPRRRVDEPVGG